MHTEVENAAGFWVKYIPETSLTLEKRDLLRNSLIEVLCKKYKGHWHMERTATGSGYRSISNWRKLDRVLVEAAEKSSVSVELLERWLPRDVILWCDPYNVTYRVGDHGTIYTVYEDKRGLLESVKKSVAEKVSKSNSDFVLSAYSTPVVLRSADGVEISRHGGASTGSASVVPSSAQGIYASPTKNLGDLRRSAMSPLRHVSTFRSDISDTAPPPRWTTPSS
ncbi:BTG-domain-containing protein [Coemansia reversa NRRL 1564]|uniref:BTG-domain-containing protein n=1 Tax=Coemansia reversa (strain ATCC 12441 / NRRL 1564) TaxID=763665 RepID=A0A2G5B4F3_COERN|nr:BTG-domain-containing protein [Coemansia reversa NRRL 1564]|eukprot:PIA13880.1 BTG-domain-containing protein [Coemansia reversa NRRL 1564]